MIHSPHTFIRGGPRWVSLDPLLAAGMGITGNMTSLQISFHYYHVYTPHQAWLIAKVDRIPTSSPTLFHLNEHLKLGSGGRAGVRECVRACVDFDIVGVEYPGEPHGCFFLSLVNLTSSE